MAVFGGKLPRNYPEPANIVPKRHLLPRNATLRSGGDDVTRSSLRVVPSPQHQLDNGAKQHSIENHLPHPRLAFGLCRGGGWSAAGRRRCPHLKKSAHAPLFLCVSPLFSAAPRLSFALAVVLDAARAARAAAAMITAVAAAVSAAAVVLLVSVITCVVVML